MHRRNLTPAVSGRAGKWITAIMWVMLVGLLSPLAAELTSVEKNDATAFLPHSAEATRALDRAQQAFAGSDRLFAVVAYARDGGLGPADRARTEADRAVLATYADAGAVGPAVVSNDGQAALISFQLAGNADEQAAAAKKIKTLLAADASPGLEVALTGSAGAAVDIIEAFSGIDSTLLLVTAGVVALLLLITYRSPILWIVPLLSVGVASQAAGAAVYLLAKHAGLTVNGQSQGILTVLVFGAGTDYALLLIARYREELRRHRNRHHAMGVALRRSFPAIFASAATVSISLLCLLAAQMNSSRGLGPVGAIGIIAAFAAMTTLLPALLVVFGRWLFWPFVPKFSAAAGADDTAEHGAWNRVARGVARRPRPIWIGTAVALAALAVGMVGMKIGLPGNDQYTRAVGSVTGQRLVSAHFPGGQSEPAFVITTAAASGQVAAAAKVQGVAQVGAPRRSADGQWASIEVVLDAVPDSPAAKQTVTRLREAVHAVPQADALVGGQTAVSLDTMEATIADDWTVMPLILGVVFLVLLLLLRSVVAPVLLLLSVVLSFAAAMGTGMMLFRAMGHPRIDRELPLLAFLFLVALGVDYTIFLMTRAREETSRVGYRAGIPRSLAVTGGVITSAGLVLAATFGVLAVLPLVSMLQLGTVVAVGVLLDTLVVRTLLVPALAVSVGQRLWWPGRLARIGPDGADHDDGDEHGAVAPRQSAGVA